MITTLQYFDELTDSIANRVIRFTPQIYRFKNNHKKYSSPFEAIGSSILMKVHERFFLITAGHIISENGIGEIGFLEDGTFFILNGKFIYVNPDGNLSKYTDLAICELDFELQIFLSKYFEFINDSEINFDYNPQNSENFLLVGYPWRKTKYNFEKQKIKVTPFKFLTDIYDNGQLGELKSLQDQNLIIGYAQRKIRNTKTGLIKKGVNPEGLSGCGVWHIPNPFVEDISKVKANLAGIVIRQDEHTSRYIIATRIHIVSEMLRIHFGLDLKPSMISRLK